MNKDIVGAVEDVKANAAVEMASLEDLYADSPKQPAVNAPAEREPVPAPPEVAKPVEQASPKPDKAQPNASADNDEDEPNDVSGLKAALKATRQKAREKGSKAEEFERKSQELERKYAELDGTARTMFAQLQQASPQQQRPQPPDANLDPAAALAYQEQTWAEQLRQRDAKIDHDLYMARVVPSQRMMRQQHADYEAMEATFAEAAKADQRLWQEIRRQEFPAEFAYQVGKEIKQRQEIQAAGSFDNWLSQQVEKKVAEKMATAQPAAPTVPTNPSNLTPPAAQRAQPPQSLARVPSVTPRNQGKSFNGPTPLGDLYK